MRVNYVESALSGQRSEPHSGSWVYHGPRHPALEDFYIRIFQLSRQPASIVAGHGDIGMFGERLRQGSHVLRGSPMSLNPDYQ